jgi:HD-like signal output (HDOD) protein
VTTPCPHIHPTLEALADSIAARQSLPALSHRILGLPARGPLAAGDLTRVILSNRPLAARILQLANSAYFGLPRSVYSIREAVMSGAVRNVRAAALAASLIDRIPDSRNIDYDAYWRFSLAVGLVAEVAARAQRRDDDAFAAGLLHNVGRLALDQYEPETMSEVAQIARRQHTSIHIAEQSLLGYMDADLGGALAKRWNLSRDIVEAIREHPRPYLMVPDRDSLAAVVVLARTYVQSCGLPDGIEDHLPMEPPLEWTEPPLATALMRAGGIAGIERRVAAFMDSFFADTALAA